MVTASRIDAMFVRDHLPELSWQETAVLISNLTGYRSSKSISADLPTLRRLDGVFGTPNRDENQAN